MSNIRYPAHCNLRKIEWHRMKSGGKRYERWRRIRPMLDDDVGDNWWPKYISKSRAKRNNRDVRRQCGKEV